MPWKADVIIPLEGAHSTIPRVMCSILDHGGAILGRLLVIDDGSLDRSIIRSMHELAGEGSQIVILTASPHSTWAASCNRGLREAKGDCILLTAQTVLTKGLLDELAEVAHREERTACVIPLGNETRTDPFKSSRGYLGTPLIDEAGLRAASSALPRCTTVPLSEGSCFYLRGDVLHVVGLLDPALGNPVLAMQDWTMRAQAMGLVVKRANHAAVFLVDGTAQCDALVSEESDGPKALFARHPQLQQQVSRFQHSLDAALATHVITYRSTGKLRLALDLRHVPPVQVGTRTYAISLGRALAEIPDIDLTLLVHDPSQGEGIKGRFLTPNQWTDDVAIIHKPAQVFDKRHLELLFESSAHLVVTYQDLIAHRIPLVFSNECDFDSYRSTNSLCLQSVQKIVAYSVSAASEIAMEFGIPRHEISVVPLGVDGSRFSRRAPDDNRIRAHFHLPNHYFFTLATDYPHKNLPALLEAYSLMRSRWTVGDPPGLILAGHTITPRPDHHSVMRARRLPEGAKFLGPVSANQLRVLYQNALAFVFPSLYEGFGLPPLESMAAGTPVIAMPFSSIPEVCGDSALYPDGLSVGDLARAMERLAQDDELRHDLKARGLARAEYLTWHRTARATLEVYRSVLLQPIDRSLQMRRALRDVIVHWADANASVPLSGAILEPASIRHACKALNRAVHRRLRRELRRLPLKLDRKGA